MKNFAIFGVGGYIAPRHLQAINETGNRLVIAMDPNDSVGILDRHTQDVMFYKDFERFESGFDSLKNTDKSPQWLAVCSPNHLHSSHVKFGLKNDCNVICEKPLVIDEREIDEMLAYEQKFGKQVNTVLQLRLHDSIVALKERVDASSKTDYDIELTYLTSRGPWYHESWKGNPKMSGGLSSNIGVHFFDMLTWIFGDVVKNELHYSSDSMESGYLELEKAKIKWVLSIDKKFLPEQARKKGMTTFRSITVDGEEFEFSGGFTDLHKRVYDQALQGNGFGLEDARTAIQIVGGLRTERVVGLSSESHPLIGSL